MVISLTHVHTLQNILPSEKASVSQQQVHMFFSGVLLFGILKDPFMVGLAGLFCLLSLAATAKTMSSTLSCWYGTSLPLLWLLPLLFGEFLADVSKNIMPWDLARVIGNSWLTWLSAQLGSRRSLLLPTRNLGAEEANKGWCYKKVTQ